MDWVC